MLLSSSLLLRTQWFLSDLKKVSSNNQQLFVTICNICLRFTSDLPGEPDIFQSLIDLYVVMVRFMAVLVPVLQILLGDSVVVGHTKVFKPSPVDTVRCLFNFHLEGFVLEVTSIDLISLFTRISEHAATSLFKLCIE